MYPWLSLITACNYVVGSAREKQNKTVFLPRGVTHRLLFPRNKNAAIHVSARRSPIRDPVPKISYSWDLVTRHPLPSTYQYSRFPARKQMFDIHHTVCTVMVHIVSHPYQSGNGGKPPEIQVMRLQPGANLVNRTFGGRAQAC